MATVTVTHEQETPEQKAARRTANATWWIAIFTVVLALVGGLTLYEVIDGSSDTKAIAEAAKKQAGAAVQQMGAMAALALAAKEQSDRTKDLVNRMKDQADATNRLATEARRSADISQFQQIPWLGIEGPTTMPLTFTYVWPAHSPIPYPAVQVDLSFSVKNYGPSPAYVLPTPALNLNLSLDVNQGIGGPSIRETCGIDRFAKPGQSSLPEDFGEVILPGASRPFRGGEVTSFGEKTPKELKSLSFTICIVYQDKSGMWRYSGYRYTAWAGQTVAIADHPGWSHAQFDRGAFLTASRAE